MMGKICCVVEGWRWGDGEEAEWVVLFVKSTENQCVPHCRKSKKSIKNDHIPFCEKCS